MCREDAFHAENCIFKTERRPLKNELLALKTGELIASRASETWFFKSNPMCICCSACVWILRLDQELHKRISYCKNALWCKHTAHDVLFLCMKAWGHVLSQSSIMSLALFSVRYSKDAALWPALAHTWRLFSVFIRLLFSINCVTSLEVWRILGCTAL